MSGVNLAPESKPMDIFVGDPRTADTDLVIVGVFEGQAAGLDRWAQATHGELEHAMASKEFSGKRFETFVTPLVGDGFRARRLAVVGLGPRDGFAVERARRAATAAGLVARKRRIPRICFHADVPLDSPEMIQAIAEGLTLAEFDAGQYKSDSDRPFELTRVGIILAISAGEAGADAARRGRVIGEHCNMARQLINEPGNALSPSVFADRLVEIARSGGLSAEILDQRDLERLGMTLLLGVGRGSTEPPKLVVLRYEPDGVPGSPVMGFVGKGITFDTGGLSIKPAPAMEHMKDDMSGGATVACAMAALGRLEAPARAIGVIPIAENMPGGRAMRPGDVLKSAAGKTVEVVNTDAEGRLILGDALWYARQLGATHLVDIATLTGAISVALGTVATGLFGTPPAFVEHVRSIAERAGERCWPLPLFDEYKDQLRSDIADMINTGGRIGGAITAAMFLKEFTGDLPWIHLDIAGTAWLDEDKPFMPKGPTGVGVATLVELARSIGDWKMEGG